MFDAHLHIIDPRFPLVPNHGYVPAPYTVADYRTATARLGVTGGAVVSGSFHGTDQRHLVEALDALGGGFVGVAALPDDIDDAELNRLTVCGVRAARFNLVRGSDTDASALERAARRVYDAVGWHSELYVEAENLPDLLPVLRRLPSVSVDHMGVHADGLPHLLRAVEAGVRVKATGFGRYDGDLGEALRQVHGIDPGALMFGTDLPGTRAPRPFRPADVELIRATIGEVGGNAAVDAVLHGNAARFYRLPDATDA